MRETAVTRELLLFYKKNKSKIRERLREFKEIYPKASNSKLFEELCFCIMTPQSNAVYCDEAIKELVKRELLLKGIKSEIRKCLKRVRFPNNKASFIVFARNALRKNKRIDLRSRIDKNDPLKTRDWLVKNIKGIGYKEASHFLRNIGLGKKLAILDVHILKNLKFYGVIKEIPSSITKKLYTKIESKMCTFAEEINIPSDEMDLLFWSKQTGFIFK